MMKNALKPNNTKFYVQITVTNLKKILKFEV